MIPIRILPLQQLAEHGEGFVEKLAVKATKMDSTIYGFNNAKGAISYLLSAYDLNRSDEVFISTTSNMNYVSSCVTCTIFNFCKPARVLTKATKMIYVIHEFGVLNPNIFELKEKAEELNIPLVEDVAHSYNSFSDGVRLGEIGDYGLFSIPKFLPTTSGGLLRTKKPIDVGNEFFSSQKSNEVLSEFETHSASLSALAKQRLKAYKEFESSVKIENKIYEVTDEESPFLIAFETTKANAIKRATEKAGLEIEYFPLHQKNTLAIPTNAFIKTEQIQHLSAVINTAI